MDPIDLIYNGFGIVIGIVGSISIVAFIVVLLKEWARRNL